MVPGWLHQAVVTSAGIFIIFMSRQFPPALQCLVAFVAIYFSSPFIARARIASGDPVPAVMSGRYLVADGIPRGSIFFQSVILLLQHDSNVGSLGIIINNPQNVGGPVASWQSILLTDRQSPEVNAVAGLDGLYWGRRSSRIGADDAGARVRIINGISGWGPRQLDGEVRRGSWKIVTADAESALSPDAMLWQTLYHSRPAVE
jgi:putative transcriptional regulator